MLTHSYKQPRKNYQGRSFKEQDLTNQDFSYADIRGADFTLSLIHISEPTRPS
mgnify:CR=1 FL=1